MICSCYPDCAPVRGCFKLVQVLNAPEKSSSPPLSLLARPPRCECRCSCMVGAEPEETSLSPSACSLVHPVAPERWGWQTKAWGSHHPPPAAPPFLQQQPAEMGKVLESKCFKNHGSSLPCRGAPRAPRDPANHQACVGLQLAQAASGKGLFSRSVETSGSGCSPGAGSAWAHVRLCACCSSWYPAARALSLAPSSGQYRPQQAWKWNRNYSWINYSNICFYLKRLYGLLS